MTQERRKDLAWAVLLGVVFALSPHTGSARPLPSLVLGALLAGLVLVVRIVLHRQRPGLFIQKTAGPTITSGGRTPWMLLVATALVFAPTLYWLWGQYTYSIWRNGHGLFVPIFMTLMIRSRLRSLPAGEPAHSAMGIPLILLGATLAVIDAGVRTGMVGTLGLILAVPGLSLVLLGKDRTRAIALPLSLILFILPTPARLTDPLWLTTSTTEIMESQLTLLNIPAFRHQSYFVLPVGMFSVSINCAGQAFLYAAYFLAVLLAATTTSVARRVLILLSPWPITVAINSVRGTVLVGLTNEYGTGISESFVHGLTGIVTFWTVMTAVMLLADWKRLLGSAPA